MSTALVRCAVYTRKSSEEGLEQSFNSLDAQREACEAYVLSQRHEGWTLLSARYDDGGFSGGNMQRPALLRLLADIAAKRIDTVVVYKVDRLTRSLADFAKIVEQFDQQGISFVSVTQQFNTTTSMGRLTLNVLLSFAQFEREVTGERIRDKIAASKRKGMWMGGVVPLGYDIEDRQLIVNAQEAKQVKSIYEVYLRVGCVSKLQIDLESSGIRSKKRLSRAGNTSGDNTFSRGALYQMLQNRVYLGEISHKEKSFPGRHEAIIDLALWDRVQTQLKENLQGKRRRARSTAKHLLTGSLFDSEGTLFTPSHTQKKNEKRYHYYVSQAVINKGKKSSTGPTRIPVEAIETLVISQIDELLGSPQRLREALEQDLDPSTIPMFLESITAPVVAARNLLPKVLQKVIVHENRIEIKINKACLLEAVLDREVSPSDRGETIDLTATLRLNHSNGSVRFHLPHRAANGEGQPVPSLVRAIARAHDWVARLRNGEIANQRALSAETGLDERYISRILPLAFLAPDIIEAILDGSQIESLLLGSCVEDIPRNWNAQRERFSE